MLAVISVPFLLLPPSPPLSARGEQVPLIPLALKTTASVSFVTSFSVSTTSLVFSLSLFLSPLPLIIVVHVGMS